MPRFLAATMAMLASACATAGTETSLERPATDYHVNVAHVDANITGITLVRDAYVARGRLPAPRRAVFAAIPEAFADVGLPLPLMDQARWTGAVQEHRVSQRLGRERLSRFFDCGQNIGGANADTRRLLLSVYVLVQPTDAQGETPIQIRVDAVAHTTEGTGAAPITCSSQGVLEQAIATALQLRAIGS
jgi:hypothetical protein